MTAPARLHGYTLDDYLDLESVSNVKHEYLEGEIYAMAGGTPRHAALTLAIAGPLLAKLRGGSCRAFSSDLRILVSATGLATYPDVAVVCGPIETDARSQVSVTNPKTASAGRQLVGLDIPRRRHGAARRHRLHPERPRHLHGRRTLGI